MGQHQTRCREIRISGRGADGSTLVLGTRGSRFDSGVPDFKSLLNEPFWAMATVPLIQNRGYRQDGSSKKAVKNVGRRIGEQGWL